MSEDRKNLTPPEEVHFFLGEFFNAPLDFLKHVVHVKLLDGPPGNSVNEMDSDFPVAGV